ncbi:histone-fold-containing protein, partial [Stereum hirsutum FP-91666 SS1]|uniref:histone-fold-containing protein n=1 Tax=Stereum hirsutum (strain FP-91666) TaxID=721885 RepID=UPI000444A073
DTHTEENAPTAPEQTTESAPPVPPAEEDVEKTASKTKKPVDIERETGKSLLPLARVQKIMKADKELPTVAKEAALIISIATEEFIKRLAEASQLVAKRENRVTIQQKDIASVVRRGDEFLFLD